MLDIQGFINITALIDNDAEGAVAPVGELSELSKTYAKNKQYFTKANLQVELVAFTYLRDSLKVKVPASFTDHILTLTQWIYNQSILGNFKNDETEFQRLLVGQYQSSISAVQTGAMIQMNGNWFPRWISWKYEVANNQVENTADHDNQIMVWFADEDFKKDYTGWEIEVLMPILPVDTFMAVKSVVEVAMAGFNLPDHHKKANEIRGQYPYTTILTNNYTWHDREDYNATLTVPMSVLIYGRAGSNPSRIKQALREYILANSNNGTIEWVKVFPEIFTTTKFTIIPGWSIRGIPNQEDIAAQYSPLLPYDFLVKAVSKFGEWRTLTVAEKNAGVIPQPVTDVCLLPSVYKSLAAVAIAGPENDSRKLTLHDVVPDYGLIGTLNPDISRMSKSTTVWLDMFFRALIAAEEYHPYNVSMDIIKLVDDANPEIYYWVFEFSNVEFRVLARNAVWQTA